MADPFSIVAGVVGLLSVSAKLTIALRQYHDEVKAVDSTVAGLLGDVKSLTQVLESMRGTFEDESIKATFQVTGHVGTHWKNLSRTLADGEVTLSQLNMLLEEINKKTSFLDGPRKHLRFKTATEQITTYRSQIQCHRDVLHLSLSTVILWNQVSFQKSTDQVLPTLDKLYEGLRHLGISLNAKIDNIQKEVADQNDRRELVHMTNLRDTVRAAVDVVSNASTTLAGEAASVKYGSDFGDVFPPEEKETMKRWMDSNTVYEYEEIESSFQTSLPMLSETGGESESDSDIETEMIRALFKNGKKSKESGDLKSAERLLRNCLTRMSLNPSYISLQNLGDVAAQVEALKVRQRQLEQIAEGKGLNKAEKHELSTLISEQRTLIRREKLATKTGNVSKLEVLDLLKQTYCEQCEWSKAKAIIMEQISIRERQTEKKDESILWDLVKLAEVSIENKEYAEAHLQARRGLRGFKKLSEAGYTGYRACLTILIELCMLEGKDDEAEGYSALLEVHKAKMASTAPKKNDASPVTAGTTPTDPRVNVSSVAKLKQENASLQDGIRLESTQYASGQDRMNSRYAQTQGLSLQMKEANVRSESPELQRTDYHLATAQGERADTFHRDDKTYSTTTVAGPIILNKKRKNSQDDDQSPQSPKEEAAGKGNNSQTSTKLLELQTELVEELHLTSSDPQLPVTQEDLASKAMPTIPDRELTSPTEVPSIIISPDKEQSFQFPVSKDQASIGNQQSPTSIQTITRKAENFVPDNSKLQELRKAGTRALVKRCPICWNEMWYDGPRDFTTCTNCENQFCWFCLTQVPRRGEWKHDSNCETERKHIAYIAELLMGIETYSKHQEQSLRRTVSDSQLEAPNEGKVTNPVLSEQLNVGLNKDLAKRFERWQSTRRAPSRSYENLSSAVAELSVTSTPAELANDPPDRSGALSVPSELPSRKHPVHVDQTAEYHSRGYAMEEAGVVPERPGWRLEKANRTPPCPICKKSLVGLSEHDATEHVNNCLDGEQPHSRKRTAETAAVELPGDSSHLLPEAVEKVVTTSGSGRDTGWKCCKCSRSNVSRFANCVACGHRYDFNCKRYSRNEEAQRVGGGAVFTTLLRRSSRALRPGMNIRRKLIVLGDAGCGKSWLLITQSNRGVCPKEATPTVYEQYSTHVHVDHLGVEFVLIDNSGQDEYDRLRRLSFGDTHVVLICFNVVEPDTYDNVLEKWKLEADEHLLDVPRILVACKIDLRGDHHVLKYLDKLPFKNVLTEETRTGPITQEEGRKLAEHIGALAYFETSSVTNAGLSELFDYAARVALMKWTPKKGLRRFLSRSDFGYVKADS